MATKQAEEAKVVEAPARQLTNEEFLEAIKELKKPYIAPEKIEAQRRYKEYMQRQQEDTRKEQAAKENNCPHIRTSPTGQTSSAFVSHLHYMSNSGTPYMETFICQRCQKTVNNIDHPSEHARLRSMVPETPISLQ